MLDKETLLRAIEMKLDLSLLEKMFDHLPSVLFYVKDREARYLVVNSTLLNHSGCRRKEEVVGLTSDDLFGFTGPTTLTQDREVISTGKPVVDVLRLFFSADGRRQWCLSSKFPLSDKAGQVVGLVGVSRILSRPDEKHASYKRLLDFLKMLEAPDQQNLRISEIAVAVNLSMDMLERLCREVFGMAPKQIMMRMRLDRACRKLENGQDSITDIATECGYSDHSAFSRQFKAATMFTPQQYRTAARAK
ncbi:transcriptional regulator, AraC family [Variovorax sp. CF079]|uniref:helix-turn-helix domain-containing protein n=1 Tax=Variovorax sp. CF079 TaxID=1882774 RepID=UPI000881686C|nr:AraC family transcriptional regulator [Variovorax sp. CF079]SDD51413.1 transcriptional regulator, AraC family [Variovorax sp. CF079]